MKRMISPFLCVCFTALLHVALADSGTCWGQQAGLYKALFDRQDRDRDGFISPAELTLGNLYQADLNVDGRLSFKEFESAQLGTMKQPPPTVELLQDSLSNPVAVAVQPGTHDLFVAEGATGRILRIRRKSKTVAAVTGLPQSSAKTGITSMTFVNRAVLLVGFRRAPGAKAPLLRAFRISQKIGNDKIPAQTIEIRPHEVRQSAATAITGIAIDKTRVYVSCLHHQSGQGWLGVSDWIDDTFSDVTVVAPAAENWSPAPGRIQPARYSRGVVLLTAVDTPERRKTLMCHILDNSIQPNEFKETPAEVTPCFGSHAHRISDVRGTARDVRFYFTTTEEQVQLVRVSTKSTSRESRRKGGPRSVKVKESLKNLAFTPRQIAIGANGTIYSISGDGKNNGKLHGISIFELVAQHRTPPPTDVEFGALDANDDNALDENEIYWPYFARQDVDRNGELTFDEMHKTRFSGRRRR